MKTIKGKKSIRGFDGPAALWAAAAAAARVLAFVLAGVVILAGCPTPDGGGDPDPTVTGVTVTADAAFVVKGGTLQFHATVAGENSPSQAVTWSVTTGGAASGTGISEAGLLTVDADESRTSLEIKAVSQQDGVTFGTKTVSVVTPNTGEIVSVTVTGTAAVGQVLTVEAKDSNGAAVTDAVFQWKRADASDGTYTDIPNATSAAYTLKTADTGKYLKAEASNAATATAVLSDAQGPVTLPASETPTASVTRVAKTSAAQAAVDFTLTNATALSGTWKVYSAAGGDTLASGVTAAVTTWPTLRLSHSSNIPAAVYYVTVTEAGKAESARLALTVGNIASSATVSTLASVLEALPANTAETPYTIVLAATNINANWGAINSAVFSSGRYVILDVSACSASGGTITGKFSPEGNDFNIIKDDDYVKGVILPDSLESIGGSAFYGCTGLTSVTIPPA